MLRMDTRQKSPDLTRHIHENGLQHSHAQYDGMPHEHSPQAMTEAGLGDKPSGPVRSY